MPIIRTSPRAFVTALIPLAVLHGALLANRIAGSTSTGAPMTMPDAAALTLALRIGIDAALFAAGHVILRMNGLGSRAAYGIMGGLAAVIGYAFAFRIGVYTVDPYPGAWVTAGFLPTGAGMIAGFLYAQVAGYDLDAMEASAPAAARDSGVPAAAPFGPSPAPLPSSFEGPLQVRSSFAAGAIASLVPSLLVTVLAVPLLMTLFVGSPHLHTLFLALPAQMFVTVLLVTIAPAALVVAATHALARSFGRTRGRDYALIAAVLNCIPACIMFALLSAALLFPLAAFAGALMGATYRRFAGVEPLALPEPVLARDPRTLVGADHPSRRTRSVILNG